MSIFVGSLFLATVLASLLSNRDLFSPAKFFLFSFLVFHVGALDGRRAPEVWLLILLVLMVGASAVLFEAVSVPRNRRMVSLDRSQREATEPRRLFVWLWLLSTPALLSQVYMIELFGGIEGYIASLGLRVIEWRGLGWARTLIGTVAALNLVYLAVALTRPRSHVWWAGYAIHFVFVLALGLLSGSRSGILNVLAMQVFTYHYIRRQVRLRTALTIAVVLVLSGLILGVVREGFRFDDGEVSTGLADAEQGLNIATLNYGVAPLEILVNAGVLKLAYGSTFISLFTNAVPRDWWPEKPDTGGIFFTKEYTGDEWDGASNLTPTLLGESVINFGWLLGTAVYLVAYPLMMWAVVQYYRRMQVRLRRCRDATAAVDFVIYLLWMWSIVALMTGELTNVLLVFALTGLFPAAVARMFTTTPQHRPPAYRAIGTLMSHADHLRRAGTVGLVPDRR